MAESIGDQLAGWGKVLVLETRGRITGRAARAAVGFVEEADGSLLVSASDPDANWALNLLAEPRCTVEVGERRYPARADPIDGADRARAVRELILRYGTPAETLGAGPAFRLVQLGEPA
ncbi:MAG TPA: nitroreductase family deazaflavin-dependent oxidoreductase [Candidatus Limnocylindrales bacterium]